MIGKLATRILLFGGSAIGMAQPTVTVRSLIEEEPRVYLKPSSSQEFAAAVAASPYDVIRQATALYPYSVALVNETDQDVIAYSINWTGKDAAGRDVWQALEEASFTTLPFSPPEVLAHGTSAIIPRRGDADVAASGPGRPWNEKKQKAAEKQLAYFSEYQSITITLEAVIFRDGLAVGQEPRHTILHWKAHLDATKEIAELVNSKSDAEARAGLEEMVKVGLERPGGHLAGGWASTTYEDAFVLQRAAMANAELGFMKMLGDAERLRGYRSATKDLVFPQVHRLGSDQQEKQK
jgi:hypothetical protein